MLLHNYRHADLITPLVKAISSSSSDRRNTGCVAVLSFSEPAPAQDFRQSPTSSADNLLQKQEKQWGGCGVVVAETRCRHRRGRRPAAWLANRIGAPVPPSFVAHAAVRSAAEPATE